MHFFLFRKAIRKLPGDVIREVPLPEPEQTDGFGSRAQTGIICRKMGAKRVLVVTDKNIHGLGVHEKVLLSLRDSGIPFTVFCEIDSEPTVDVIRAGSRHCLVRHRCPQPRPGRSAGRRPFRRRRRPQESGMRAPGAGKLAPGAGKSEGY